MTTSKMLMIAVIASNMITLTRANYETDKGFIKGSGYVMDQPIDYVYVYFFDLMCLTSMNSSFGRREVVLKVIIADKETRFTIKPIGFLVGLSIKYLIYASFAMERISPLFILSQFVPS